MVTPVELTRMPRGDLERLASGLLGIVLYEDGVIRKAVEFSAGSPSYEDIQFAARWLEAPSEVPIDPELVALAEQGGDAAQECLDDLVHGVYSGIASDTNNQGIEGQLSFLLLAGITPETIKANLLNPPTDDN